MSTFTNSITSIVNSGYVSSLSSPKQKSQIAQALKNSAIDSVTFSNEAQNLFQIAQIDSMLDGIFGLPKTLTEKQKAQLQSVKNSLDAFAPNSSARLSTIDFEEIYQNLGLEGADKATVKKLALEINNYIAERSVSQLFGNENSAGLSFFSNGFEPILGKKLTGDETLKLGDLSLQLNRLLYSGNDSQTTSYIDLFNEFYGLKDPTDEQLFDATSLLTKRNTLLSSVLLNRELPATYFFKI